MNTNDILKVRSALASQLALALLGKPDSRELARETIAAFERLVDRLVSEPVDAPPQMPLRAYIADLLEAAKGALKVLNPATAGVFYENLKAAIAKAESH